MIDQSADSEGARSGLFLRHFMGYAAYLLAGSGDPQAKQGTLLDVVRFLGIEGESRREGREPLTPADYAEAVVWLAHQLGERMQYEVVDDQINFTKGLFGEVVQREPNVCSLWWESLRRMAVESFGYGKVVFTRRIAHGQTQWEIRLYLKPTTDANSAAGIAYPVATDRSSALGREARGTSDETVRQLQAKIRVLEQRTRELENALEERKLIEKAKGLLMERLRLSEAEAMRKLQKESQTRNKKLAEISRIIVQAGEIM